MTEKEAIIWLEDDIKEIKRDLVSGGERFAERRRRRMNESYNRRKMPGLQKDEKQDHRHPYGKRVSEAQEGMPLLRGQMEHD